MQTKPFSADQFTSTEWHSAEDKAKWANTMAAWATKGFPRDGFTKTLYTNLHTNMYAHIAHYDIYGFYAEWFFDNYRRFDWLCYAANGGALGSAGSPLWSWCDVERAFSAWIWSSGLIERYQKLCADETEARERALLATLQEKYTG